MGAGCSCKRDGNVIVPTEAMHAWTKLNDKQEILALEAGSNTRTLFLGLSGCGKSSLIHALIAVDKRGPGTGKVPGIIPNCASTRRSREYECNFKGTEVIFVDTPGRSSSRSQILKLVQQVNRVAYVVDASNPDYLPLARADMDRLVSQEPSLLEKPMLVVVSKTDAPGAMPQNEVLTTMRLSRKLNRRTKPIVNDIPAFKHPTCCVMQCSLRNTESVEDVLDFLLLTTNPRNMGSTKNNILFLADE